MSENVLPPGWAVPDDLSKKINEVLNSKTYFARRSASRRACRYSAKYCDYQTQSKGLGIVGDVFITENYPVYAERSSRPGTSISRLMDDIFS